MSADEEAALRRAAIGSALFMVAGPGVVTGLVPWLLTGWESRRPSSSSAGCTGTSATRCTWRSTA
jgi:hypothetical protein